MPTASEYTTAVLRRNREPLSPEGFTVNWADRPRTHNVYPDVARIPLPAASVPVGSVDSALRAPAGPATGQLTLAWLGEMLRESYGVGGRRLAPNANDESDVRCRYTHAFWSRGTASGGGMYPLEIYWVCGPSAGLLPGVYNYSAPHHALQRLLVGDVSHQVRAALADPDQDGDQFLLVTIRFWKNAFKYNNFCYHAVTTDVGAALGTWQLWSRAAGVPLRPVLNFAEAELNRLLGIDTHEESVFAVIPLPWASTRPLPRAANAARVTVRATERSRSVLRFPMVEEVHAATVGTAERRTTPEQLAAAAPVRPHGTLRSLPPPVPLDTDVTTALRARRSSFGTFCARRPMTPGQLAALLVAGNVGARLVSDVKHADGTPALTRLMAFVNHVDGVEPGVYDYDPDEHALAALDHGSLGLFLQRNYFLHNYNLEQAAAVLAVVARPYAVLDAAGERGYRYLNAEVGAAAQALYTACAAAGLGCGVALGFDSVSYVERFGRTGGDEWPLLIAMVGPERGHAPDFRYRLT